MIMPLALLLLALPPKGECHAATEQEIDAWFKELQACREHVRVDQELGWRERISWGVALGGAAWHSGNWSLGPIAAARASWMVWHADVDCKWIPPPGYPCTSVDVVSPPPDRYAARVGLELASAPLQLERSTLLPYVSVEHGSFGYDSGKRRKGFTPALAAGPTLSIQHVGAALSFSASLNVLTLTLRYGYTPAIDQHEVMVLLGLTDLQTSLAPGH